MERIVNHSSPSPTSEILNENKPEQSTAKRTIAVGIGNFMEWFDFAIYGYFAAVIGMLFFPSNAPGVSFLSALAVFAVGFVARPFGAALLGPIGDKLGRKVVLIITVFGMGVFTTLIGLLPSYASIGIWAPILLITFRFFQGMMVGGEWSSAGIFLVESAKQNRRALAASIITTTAGLAFLIGTATAAWINATLTEHELMTWGWRIPFILSLFMTIIALYIRRKLSDTPIFEELHKKGSVIEEQREYLSKREGFIVTFAFSALFGVSLYYFITYMNNHLVKTVQLSPTISLIICSIALIFYVIFNPLVALALDKFGRRKILLCAAFLLAILAYPLFLLINTGSFFAISIALIILGLLVAITAVCDVVLLVEIFPASTRSTSAALGHNLALAILAGPGPFIAAYLIQVTHNPNVPAWYLSAVAFIAFIILWKKLPETINVDITKG
ncbi:MFS transporter [Acinetobacter sp. ANC 4558]|uniref:MFS transporter n=1 Tax=Acinetobacter sp. ANC 4558 TaxID=1977876 RepID=UPI000A3422AA|nr:MFS transporter [Acinetobacter sp. ANC 4558]OTG86156.1 MFS transporter [Acinetobacter sp. ANC 4558]